MSLTVVTGPPASGKTTWVQQQAQPGDIVIDFDALANTLSASTADNHNHTSEVVAVTKATRKAAITAATAHANTVDVYLIHSTPSVRTVQRYRYDGARIVVVDPGYEVTMDRCRRLRPTAMIEAAERWYREHGYDHGEPATPGNLSRSW